MSIPPPSDTQPIVKAAMPETEAQKFTGDTALLKKYLKLVMDALRLMKDKRDACASMKAENEGHERLAKMRTVYAQAWDTLRTVEPKLVVDADKAGKGALNYLYQKFVDGEQAVEALDRLHCGQ